MAHLISLYIIAVILMTANMWFVRTAQEFSYKEKFVLLTQKICGVCMIVASIGMVVNIVIVDASNIEYKIESLDE